MQLGNLKAQIMTGKVCPYCFKPTEFIDSKKIYGKSYGMVYYCRPDHAWVGVHKGTAKALGRLANSDLREAKKDAHYWFDGIARTGLINSVWPKRIRKKPREKAYIWLSIQMKLERDECHIGMFDEEQCAQVVEICKKALDKLAVKDNK